MAYTPEKTRRYEDLIRFQAGEIMGEAPPIEGPLVVLIAAYVSIPNYIARSKVKMAAVTDGSLRPTARPDCDNLAKVVDALNHIVWKDDAQIVYLSVAKFYGLRPRLEITVSEFSKGDAQ